MISLGNSSMRALPPAERLGASRPVRSRAGRHLKSAGSSRIELTCPPQVKRARLGLTYQAQPLREPSTPRRISGAALRSQIGRYEHAGHFRKTPQIGSKRKVGSSERRNYGEVTE